MVGLAWLQLCVRKGFEGGTNFLAHDNLLRLMVNADICKNPVCF